MNVIPTDADLARFQTSLVSDSSIVPADVVRQMLLNLVDSVQARIDFDNAQAMRSYLGGTNDDGTHFVGAWEFWFALYQAAPDAQKADMLKKQPWPPFGEVMSLSGPWPTGVMGTIPLCPQPQIPQAPTGIFIGAPLSAGWYAIVLGDRNPAGTLVNFNGAVLQRVVYPFGGWWAPGSTTQPLTSLPVAQPAPPFPVNPA